MGLVRSLWQLSTVVIAGPAVAAGLLAVFEGRYPTAALFVGLAVAFALVSEVAYRRVTGGTVGRVASLWPDRGPDE